MSTAPFSVSARALRDDIRHTRKLSLGCAVLDRALGGGVDVQGLTEVAGSAGAGKTQLVLRCLLHVQLPPSEGGLSGGAIYIFSEGSNAPSLRRLQGLADVYGERYRHLGATSLRLMQQVITFEADEPERLLRVLDQIEAEILRTTPIRLIVLDSIAAVFRSDDRPDDPYGKADRAAELAERTKAMLAVAARLKQLSHRYDLAVLATNQVTDKPAEAVDTYRLAPWERGASLAAAQWV